LDENYDSTHGIAVFKHLVDFYSEAGEGSELHVMVIARTETLTTALLKTNNFAAKLLADKKGRIKLLAVARNPLAGYTPTVTNGVDADVFTAIANAKDLRTQEAGFYRYCQFIVEGRSFAGAAGIATMTDLRAVNGPNANRVSVCLSAEPAQSLLTPGYASVGLLLGRLAADPVQRNPGRVKSGPLSLLNAALSNGAAVSTFTDTQLNILNDKGYIFLRQHSGKDGFYFSNDWTATKPTDDYSRIARGRVMDKASRLVREVYVEELLDEVDVDPTTGLLATSQIKSYQASAQTKLEQEMKARKEIAGVVVTVDADQNVLSTDEIQTTIDITPRGVANRLKATLSYSNPSN